MSGELRVQAQEDLSTCIQEEFGQRIRVSRADGSDSKEFIGNSNFVATMLDPNTGLLITGQSCQATLMLKEIIDHFGGLPASLWQVEFLDISPASLKVKDVQPDSTQGALILVIGD